MAILVTWPQFFERWINLYITHLVSLNCDLSHGECCPLFEQLLALSMYFILPAGLRYSILQLYLGKEKKYYKRVISKAQSCLQTVYCLTKGAFYCLRNPDLDIQNLKYHTRLPPVVSTVTLCFHCYLPQANILLNPSE